VVNTNTVQLRRPIRIPWLYIYSVLVIIYLFFPIGIIVLFSFNSSPAVSFPIRGFSLRWYMEVLESPVFLAALKNSLVVAVFTTFFCLSLGTLAALALTRYRFRFRPFVQSLFLMPLSLPGLFLGISLLTYFISLNLRLSLGTVVVGHVIYTLPYFVLVATARLERFDRVLEEAAQDLGCTPWQTFWKVNFPIIAPSMIGAALIVFALSFDEVIVTTFTSGQQNTLPIWIFSQLTRPRDRPVTNVVALFVVLIMAIPILLSYRISQRDGETQLNR